MKTQTLMIPLALLILMLFKSMGFGMQPPKKTVILSSILSIEQQEALISEHPTYPILSTKDYRPVQQVQDLVNEDVIEFYYNNKAVFSMHIDENGDCVQNSNAAEHAESEQVDNGNSNLLDNFRQASKAFLKQSVNRLWNEPKQSENETSEPKQSDKKYFMSDYR
jgi:hypothetical protein